MTALTSLWLQDAAVRCLAHNGAASPLKKAK